MRSAVAAACIALVLGSAAHADPVITFARGQLVSLNSGDRNQFEPSIAADGKGGVYIAWKDGQSGSSRIRYAYSHDYGETWSQDALLEHEGYKFQSDPVVVIGHDGRVTVSWVAYNTFSDTAIGFRVSRDRGVTFGEPSRLSVPTREGAKDFFDRQWHIVNGDEVITSYHVGNRIFVTRSADGGKTVEGVANPDGDRRGALSAVLARSPDGKVHSAWLQFGRRPAIRYSRSADGGKTWDTPRDIVLMYPLDYRGRAQCFPTIGVDPQGTIHIAWAEGKGRDGSSDKAGDVYAVRSEDGGETWSAPLKLTDGEDADDAYKIQPWLEVDATGRVHVVWLERRGTHWSVRYTLSADGGKSFSPTVPVTTPHLIRGPYHSDFIAVCSDSRFVYVAAPIPVGGVYSMNVMRAPVAGVPAGPVAR
ncbi:MAG: exo-alpha-sialidase [Fimbriimonadia bacterium]|jgi:hypothetical protein